MTSNTNKTEQNQPEPGTFVTDGITWHYGNSSDKQLLTELSKKVTTSDSNSDNSQPDNGNIKLVKENARRKVFCTKQSGTDYYIKIFNSEGISEKAKIAARGNPAESEAEWLNICMQNQLPVPAVVGYSSGKANMLVTKSLGNVTGLDEIISQYSDSNGPTLYANRLPGQVRQAITQAGILVGKMQIAGLILPDLHGGNIMLDSKCSKAYLLDLQIMKRCEPANIKTICENPILENTARFAAEISICCGRGGLELFLESYLETIKNIISLNDYITIVERAIDAWHVKFYDKRDKRCSRNNEFFSEIDLGNNFHARVFLKNNRPLPFSDISKMSFTAEQWQTALEPLKNSMRLFSSKQLTLKLGENEIAVDIEGGPTKDILKKWQYGHALINRHIATPWPLALVYNDKQAVLLTEKTEAGISMNFRNILIVKPSALGDVARMLPVLYALRNKYPKAKISWIIRPEFADLVRHNPALDDVILFDKKHLLKSGLKNIANIRTYAQTLKQRKFDLVLDAQGLLRSGLMTWFTNAPVRIGYKNARELAWLFYNHKVDTPALQHSNQDCWDIGLAAGIEDCQPEFGVPVNPAAYDTAKSILTENNIADGEEFVTLLCGGTADTKIWPAEQFAKLADIINQKYNLRCILLGAGSREEKIGQKIISSITDSNSVVNLISKTSLAEMVAILSFSRMVIGNDSGPLHIAAALPKPLIGLYGPTNPKVVGPYSQNDNVIEAGNEIERKGRYSKNPAHMINRITVESVIEKFESIVRKKQNE